MDDSLAAYWMWSAIGGFMSIVYIGDRVLSYRTGVPGGSFAAALGTAIFCTVLGWLIITFTYNSIFG